MIAKFILPWFGGGPAVWTTCMLFFQVLLLLGYAYAHLISEKLGKGKFSKPYLIHFLLLGVSLFLLPITPEKNFDILNSGTPLYSIIFILVTKVGLPYFILSSTAPLLQKWYSQLYKERSPYRLYALSNLGSFLGLILYPFFVEIRFDLVEQTRMWSKIKGIRIPRLTNALAYTVLLTLNGGQTLAVKTIVNRCH